MPMTSELVAETDHVDHWIDVNIDFDLGAAEVRCACRIDVDIANLGVDHHIVGQHVIHAHLRSQAPRVLHVQAAEALALSFAAELVIEEPGVVDASADVGLER